MNLSWKKCQLTCPRFDCFPGSFSVGRCALNCRLRVTDLASFANFDNPRTKINFHRESTTRVDRYNKSPPFVSSLSIGCFRAVISLKVSKNRTTISRSFLIGAICNKSHNGVSAKKVQFLYYSQLYVGNLLFFLYNKISN